ncbi:type I phosphomannose isomerase catalytic subunit [Phytohalomonas tamaricis]|uniref:type I phosphomannose isomerase catalytic subunit n=1 Tax=Phytohalomonas tamaricis TaxID=2081032 RepID=UPI000D0BD31E|nr:type I phosphomannose isomerase catalytic subunit [Phytohalomonas tamaricis]
MEWYPLRLSTPLAHHVFGGQRIAEQLGKKGLPDDKPVAESWEVSDVEGKSAEILNGAFKGRSLHELVEQFPNELVEPGWQGPHFPLLFKFIDATGMLPVHLHADDETARRTGQWPHGKTESWHILWAAPEATLLLGVKQGVDKPQLRDALLRQAYDEVMHRYEVRAGDTFYVPAGTLHSFGPGTLLCEIQQTADIQQQAMPWQMEDGSELSRQEWEQNIDALLEEINLDLQSGPQPGLVLHESEGVERRICCAGPYFALERLRIVEGYRRRIDRATLLTNLGAPVTLSGHGWEETLGRAETLLLPAALGEVELHGASEVIINYVPKLEQDIWQPLKSAGYSEREIRRLGDVEAKYSSER